MNAVIRPTRKDDEPFLWEMLYYAAHLQEEGETSPEAAKRNPDLTNYVKDWGRNEMDVGCIALEPAGHHPIGAAWIRLLGDKELPPELAIAVLPEYAGRGVGTQLLRHVLEAAKQLYSSVTLSVRTTNPPQRLYERMGFVVVEKITNRVGTQSLLMLHRLE
jgi:ribosomal protein S18 acetylase RimI-like enzyme